MSRRDTSPRGRTECAAAAKGLYSLPAAAVARGVMLRPKRVENLQPQGERREIKRHAVTLAPSVDNSSFGRQAPSNKTNKQTNKAD